MDYHVIPIGDLKEHEEAMSCHCDPKIEILANGNVMFTHNAYDKREAKEVLQDAIKGYQHNISMRTCRICGKKLTPLGFIKHMTMHIDKADKAREALNKEKHQKDLAELEIEEAIINKSITTEKSMWIDKAEWDKLEDIMTHPSDRDSDKEIPAHLMEYPKLPTECYNQTNNNTMTILDTIKSFEFDPNRKKLFGIKSGIVWGYSNQSNSVAPLLYISKPKHISQEDFDLLLSNIEITIRT
jgi:hypothetical protein